MTRCLIKPFALRILAAILVAVAAVGAQSAPLPSGGGRCSACGAMKAALGEPACCCCADEGQPPAPADQDRDDGPRPCSCPECCLPQARNPVVAEDGRTIGRPSPLAFALADPPAAAAPAGVHVSVFHPPRA